MSKVESTVISETEMDARVGIRHKISFNLKKDFYEYACAHQTIGNKWSHSFGVPAVMIGILGLLSYIQIGSTTLNLGFIIWTLVNLWLFSLDKKLAIPFALVSLVGLMIGAQMSLLSLFILFILGWIAQLVGHYKYEKKKPSFLTGVRHLVIGPVWLLSRLLKL